ncbi:hypothetical protein HII31_03429 [Pseudocercospora fuligena]|uniref:N-acetylgalactosaminide beta-1,3-galactosyltransferase n=1 Tax=Pseudocercospora fuligena TaxID=685502 RepID=A0A8H6VJY4_9PEZI|nr:hypothetical protein HII31_03429 [Pseudocercospora fuligena]
MLLFNSVLLSLIPLAVAGGGARVCKNAPYAKMQQFANYAPAQQYCQSHYPGPTCTKTSTRPASTTTSTIISTVTTTQTISTSACSTTSTVTSLTTSATTTTAFSTAVATAVVTDTDTTTALATATSTVLTTSTSLTTQTLTSTITNTATSTQTVVQTLGLRLMARDPKLNKYDALAGPWASASAHMMRCGWQCFGVGCSCIQTDVTLTKWVGQVKTSTVYTTKKSTVTTSVTATNGFVCTATTLATVGTTSVETAAVTASTTSTAFTTVTEDTTTTALTTSTSEPRMLSLSLPFLHKGSGRDHEEVFQGQQIVDVLQDVSDDIKENNPDFELWRRLAGEGRSALRNEELSNVDQSSQNLKGTEKFGKQTNPGWKLDKWKFLPMLNLTLSRAADNFKWFVFVETDTYLTWQNLLDHLHTFDPKEAWYLGLRYNYTGATFAYGGSGFAVSRPAMEKVVTEYRTRKDHWEDFTAGHWAGDAVLGTAFEAVGLDVTVDPSATWMSYGVGEAGYHGLNESFLCARPISYHHMSPEDIQGMWNFEMPRSRDRTLGNPQHRDILTEYILPQMISWPVREHWNNYANSDYGPVESVADCQDICEGIQNCVQYMLSSESRCLLGSNGRLGSRSDQEETAGWMIERMREFTDQMPKCA